MRTVAPQDSSELVITTDAAKTYEQIVSGSKLQRNDSTYVTVAKYDKDGVLTFRT